MYFILILIKFFNKKLFLSIITILFFSQNISEAAFKYKVGDKIYGDFKINDRTIIPLPEGEWKIIYRYGENIFRGIHGYLITLAQTSESNVVKLIEIEKIDSLSTIKGYITPLFIEEIFKPKRHGCIKRKYYTLLKYYKSSGISHNCVSIKHIDTNYEIYENEDPNVNMGYLINWVINNNLNFSDTYLAYDLSLYIPRITDRYISISFFESPQSFANYEPINNSEAQSEFHPQNIDQYPEAKRVMEEWISYIAYYHQSVENGLKLKDKYKLDFGNNVKFKSKKDDNEDVVEMLERLNNLYKSNVLTKDEFNKAKEKLLNLNN